MESLSDGSARVLERNRCSEERERGVFPEGTIFNEEGELKKINKGPNGCGGTGEWEY